MERAAFPLLELGNGPGCRKRRPGLNGPGFRTIPLGAAIPRLKTATATTWNSFAPGACFFIAMGVFMLSGVLCISSPQEPTTSFGAHVIPETATCVRVTRHTDYTTVDLAFGSPSVVLNLLLRLDMVMAASATAVRLFSNRVAESATVACDGSVCTDVALVTLKGPASEQERVQVGFTYTNPTTESVTYDTAVTMGLKGEFALNRGNDYFLTATHLCWAPVEPVASWSDKTGFAARVDADFLTADASAVGATSAFKEAPASIAESGATCEVGVGEVRIFPGAASDEATWLGLASKRAYESSPENVADRRTVVEVGSVCASNHSSYERARSLQLLDCASVYVECELGPSLPFRRAASTQLRVQIRDDGSDGAIVFAERDGRLTALPNMSPGHTMGLAVVKLTLMLLAAAVTWIRSAKATASVPRLFLHCVRAAHCPILNDDTLRNTVVLEDQLVGLIAVGARIGVAIWRTMSLLEDGVLRAPLTQLIAGGLSLLLWGIRYFALDRHCETPLTKLGGSTALVDATTAVLLAFAQSPLFVSSSGKFDPTARLLTALLVVTMTLPRCLFAVACCATLWAVASEESSFRPGAAHVFTREYALVALVALLVWLIQTASIGILIADVFATPLAFSTSRAYQGGTAELAMAIFAALTASGLPGLLRTVEVVAETPVRRASAE